MPRDNTPQLASTAWGRTPAVARTARGRELQRIQADAKRLATERRERVFKHEWAKRRLCAIFGYTRPDQWNGYVPPASDPAEDRGSQLARPNKTPARMALVQLMREVKHFEETGELPAYATPADGE